MLNIPYGNKGYDFICGRGYKVDVKSSCLHSGRQWVFNINHNTIADYFLFLAFDNRDNLNPLHLWIVPGHDINHLSTASISRSTIDKWEQYELTDKIEQVISCCNVMKNTDTNKGDIT